LESLAVSWDAGFKKGRGPYTIAESDVEREKVLLAKPATYMNRSGYAVGDLFRRYPVTYSQFLVVCDDLNLSLGKLRMRRMGSDGGHKGLASIIETLGANTFPRLRLGIGFPPDLDTTEYVLSPFLSEERSFVDEMIASASQAVIDFIQNGIEWTMNFYNQ
jgi:PTH1 family peptidyl-tRNA hydrolase